MIRHDLNNRGEHLAPPEYNAAGDALRGQMSADLSLVTPTEIFAMNTSLLTTVTKDDSSANSRLNDPCVHSHPHGGQIVSFQKRQLENVVPVTDRDSSSVRFMPDAELAENDDTKLRFASKSRRIETKLECHISLDRETPCKEYPYNTPRVSNHEDLTSVHSGLTRVMATNEKNISLRNTNEDYNVEDIFSPDRKISMFSKEIWTEKVLPIDTFVCPEPELVEIYFDKNKMTKQLKRFGECSTESVELSAIQRGHRRSVSARKYILNNRPLSATKDKTSSPGQKTINFDDEIWPVCPKLIPSGKELSFDVSVSRHEVISPEKLTENGEEARAITHPMYSLFGASSKSSTKQYDVKNNSQSEKVIEPTHEIEGQNKLASRSEVGRLCGNNYSPCDTLQANFLPVKEPREFDNVDRTDSNNLWNKEFLAEPRTSQQLIQARNSQQKVNKSFESSQTRTVKKNRLFVSNSEPVSTVLKDTLSRRDIASLDEVRSPAISCNEIISLVNMKIKQGRENCGSNFHAYPKAETVKNQEVFCEHVEKTFHTPKEIICEISREVDLQPSKFSGLNSRNTIREKSAELSSKNQSTCREIHGQKIHARSLGAAPSSKLPARKVGNVEKNVEEQEVEKDRKFVKMVRFKTREGHNDTTVNRTGTKLQENFEEKNIGLGHGKVHLNINNPNSTPDCISSVSFKQEIDHLASQIVRQIEIDPASDDAVVILAKIEIIVEANRQTVERLQQLQPNVAIPQLIPPDAEKSLAKALMRCRNYTQNNGLSRDATSTINKLLKSRVQDLKQLVEWQKLALAAQSKKWCAMPGGRRQSKQSRQENTSNTERIFTGEEFGVNQVQILISDILTLTEKLVPKLNREESQRKSSIATNNLHNSARGLSKNKSAIVDSTSAKAHNTDSRKELKFTLEADANKVTQPLSVPEANRAKELVKSASERPMTCSGTSSNPRISGYEENKQTRTDQKDDVELETTQSRIARSTYSKKNSSTDSTKTLKKIFNELWDKRSKTLARHYNTNDYTNNFRSLAGSHNVTVSQKSPIWKPGGNNFVQPSMSVIPSNQRVRPPQSSTLSKKKNAISELARDKKAHQRTKVTPSIINDPPKSLEKSVIRPQKTTSLAKIRTDPARRHHSDVLSSGRSRVHIPAEVNGTRTRKPRSKSRTRTKTPVKISRITVTEIPLEHANDLPVAEQETPVVEELTLTKKISSPKDIIQMLEELIKSSGDETSIQNAPHVQVVGRCSVSVNNVRENVDRPELLKTKGELMNANNLTPSNERGDSSISSKFVEEIVEKSENPTIEEEKSVPNILAKPDNLHKKLDSISSLNAEVFTVSRSNSEVISNHSVGGQTAPFVSKIGSTTELSSEHSIGSVFSKYCQASLTSLTSHEISEELISSQLSDAGVTSCNEETQKNSNNSFDTIEDDEATRENCLPQLRNDQSASASSSATPKKKFFNRHARSLEMLKEILSDQGLGIHLLSRAEDKLRDKCKSSSSKGGLTARRSLQGTNLTASRFSGEPINGVSLLDRNSTTLCSKLPTLSESEDDIEHVEVATMTSPIDSTVGPDYLTSTKFDSVSSKEEKLFLDKVVTVENATQFDITLKSDVSVGDGTICDAERPFIVHSQKNHTDDSTELYTSSDTFSLSSLAHQTLLVHDRESFECKLPDGILDAFRLAAIRATNVYAAVHILGGNMLSESIPTHMPAHRVLPATDENLLNSDEMKSGQVQHLKKGFDTGSGIKLPEQSQKPKTNLPVKITIPRIRVRVNDAGGASESTKFNDEETPKEKVTDRISKTFVKEFSEKRTGDKSRSACDLNDVDNLPPIVPPKPLLARKRTSDIIVERKIVEKKEIIDSSHVINPEILVSTAFVPAKGLQSPPSSKQSSVERCITGKQIETLHFAGKRIASVVKGTESAGCKSSNANFASYESTKVGGKIRDSFAGSRIKTLLERNLQRFKTDYNPIVDQKIFTDFGDQLTESSDDEVLIDKPFAETTTSTSCAHLGDSKSFSNVRNLLNYLMDAVEENCESSTVTEQRDLNTHPPRDHRLRKHVRKSKLGRTRKIIKRSILCDKYSKNLSGIVMSREYLLSLIYAAICSFVFCCLQFSVQCEV